MGNLPEVRQRHDQHDLCQPELPQPAPATRGPEEEVSDPQDDFDKDYDDFVDEMMKGDD